MEGGEEDGGEEEVEKAEGFVGQWLFFPSLMIPEQVRWCVSNAIPRTDRKLSGVANWLNWQQEKKNQNQATLMNPPDVHPTTFQGFSSSPL